MLMFSFLLSTALQAQIPAGRIEGTVQNPAEKPVTGARISAVLDLSGARVEAESDMDGWFVFPALVPGVYSLSVESDGYKPVVRAQIVLGASQIIRERITLVAGSSQEPEREDAARDRLNISRAEIAAILTRQDLEALPVIDRLPTALSIYQPGVQIAGGNPGISVVNGTRQTSNNVSVDGMEANDQVNPRLGLSSTPTNLDSVDQLAVITAGGSAEYGRNAGAQVMLVTRSGGSRWSGSAFDYFRDKLLNANDFFNNAINLKKPRFTQNVYGGSIGGPLAKDRTFIFGNYQGRHTNQSIARDRLVLTPTAKTGVFQWIQPGTSTTSSFDIGKNDPRKLGIDPQVAAILGKMPDPNNTDIGDGLNTSGYRFNSPNKSDEDQGTVKGDHNLTDRHRIFVRFSYLRNKAVDSQDGADATYPGQVAGRLAERHWGGSFGSEWSLSPVVVNEFRGGYQWAKISLERPARVAGPMLLANSWTDPLNSSFGQWRNSPVIGARDNLTWILGSHAIKAGVSFSRTEQKSENDAGIYANVTFARANGNVPSTSVGPSGITISPVARQTFENLYNDLLGRMDQVTQTFYGDLQSFLPSGTGRSRSFRYNEYGVFLQDDWKVKPNLTVNLGVRYELRDVPSESGSILGALDKAGSINSTAQISDFSVVRGGAWYKRDATNVAPRVGMAWRPFDNTKTVIRAGYGVYFDRLPGKTVDFVDNNTPLTARTVSIYPNLGGTDIRLKDGIPSPAQPAAPSLKPANTRSTSIALFTPDLRTPRVQHYHASIERQFMKYIYLQAAYVGERGQDLFMNRNFNQLKVGGDFLSAFQEIQKFRATGTPVSSSNTLARIFGSVNGAVQAIGGSVLDQGAAGTAAETVDQNYSGRYAAAGVSDFYLRNYTQFDQFLVGSNSGKSYYDSMQLSARMNQGPFKFLVNYTWSKSLDNISNDCSGCTSPIESFDVAKNKSLSDGYRKKVLNFWVQYAIPLGRGRQYAPDAEGIWGAIIGGWDLSVLGVRASGAPFSVTSGLMALRPDVASYANYTGSLPKGEVSRETHAVYYFTTDQINALSIPGAGDIGNTGRNAFIGPDYSSFDAALTKNLMTRNERKVNLRIEVYNVFNHMNFGQLNTNLADKAGFGKFSATDGAPRRIQVALRFYF